MVDKSEPVRLEAPPNLAVIVGVAECFFLIWDLIKRHSFARAPHKHLAGKNRTGNKNAEAVERAAR
jgi:hypothetical protein